MKATVRWLDGMAFVGETGSGHAIVTDGPPDLGGRNIGMRPMELMLLGVGSCSSVDVVHILKKSRQAVTDCRCELSAERADAEPAVFTKIHLHFKVTGHNLSDKHVARAVALSADKYCSASIMLKPSVEISYDYEMLDAAAT